MLILSASFWVLIEDDILIEDARPVFFY